MDIKTLLEDLKLQEFKGVFEEHGITYDIIFELGDEEIKELFPKIGQRLIFKKGIERLKQQKEIPITFVDSFILQSTPSRTTTYSDTDLNEPWIDENKSKPTPSQTSLKSDNNLHNHQIDKPKNLVNDILNGTLDGRAILHDGLVGGGLLKERSRRKLSQLVILHILEQNPTKTINTKEFISLVKQICEIFTKESTAVYYSAYVSTGLAKKNASGKLYELYISRRRKLRETGDLPGTKRLSSTSSNTTSTTTKEDSENATEDLCEDIYEESLSFLKNSVEPWKSIEEKWQETRSCRMRQINGKGNIADYFRDFPALKQPQGYVLLLQDFFNLFPGKETILHSALTNKKDEIITYARKRIVTTRDKYLKEHISKLLDIVDDDIPETSLNVAIGLLPLIVNISALRKKKNKPTWKPSRAEISESFIAQAATEGDVTSFIISRRLAVSAVGRTLQPFLIYVGRSFVDIIKVYVVINDTLYEFQKLITAVDCAFKIFHATGAYYPEESQDIWTFIQLGLYNIQTKFDRRTQAVNTLLTDLQLN